MPLLHPTRAFPTRLKIVRVSRLRISHKEFACYRRQRQNHGKQGVCDGRQIIEFAIIIMIAA